MDDHRPLCGSGNREQLVSAGWDVRPTEVNGSRELDLGGRVCTGAPNLTKRNQITEGFAPLEARARVANFNIRDADALFDRRCRARRRELQLRWSRLGGDRRKKQKKG